MSREGVRKRGGRWWVSYTDPATKRRVRETLGPQIKTEAQAKARRRQILAEAGAAVDEPPGFTPLEEVVAAFLEDKGERREKWTVTSYRKHTNALLRHIPGTTPIDEITPERLAGYLRARVESDPVRKVSKATANKELVTLRVLWAWAERRELATRNPAKKVDPYSVRPGRRDPPDEKLVDEAIAALRVLARDDATRTWTRGEETRDREARAEERDAAELYADVLEFVGWTALRIGEVSAIEPEDVDLSKGEEVVRTRSSRYKGPRRVPLVGPALAIVRRRLAARAVLVEAGEEPARLVFLTSAGRSTKWALNEFGKGWRNVNERFASVVPHGIRHLVADKLRRAGVHPIVAARILGHSTIQMHAHYSHEEISEARAALRRLGRGSPGRASRAGRGGGTSRPARGRRPGARRR